MNFTAATTKDMKEMSKKFFSQETVEEQTLRLKEIQIKNPQLFSSFFKVGQELVELADKGTLREFHHVVEKVCLFGRYDIMHYMLSNGFDPTILPLRELLHEIIENAVEHIPYQKIISYLLQYNFDVNYQRPSDLYTPLHVACEKHSYDISCLLILYGADVNAVASKDKMPLTLAVADSVKSNKQLIAYLIENGAKMSWRQNKNTIKKNYEEQFNYHQGNLFETSAVFQRPGFSSFTGYVN